MRREHGQWEAKTNKMAPPLCLQSKEGCVCVCMCVSFFVCLCEWGQWGELLTSFCLYSQTSRALSSWVFKEMRKYLQFPTFRHNGLILNLKQIWDNRGLKTPFVYTLLMALRIKCFKFNTGKGTNKVTHYANDIMGWRVCGQRKINVFIIVWYSAPLQIIPCLF